MAVIRQIGLTGGIGSGKSTVAARFAALGATVVDTDAIAHRLTAPGGEAMPAIRSAFGDEVVAPDGALDRHRMRALAFGDPGARQRLEAILHPMIGQTAQREAAAAPPGGVVLFDVPLLTEASPWRRRCQRIVVVDCPAEVQVQRVMARSGWDEAQVHRVIAQQIPRERRLGLADAVIHNDGLTLQALAEEVLALWRHWFGPPVGQAATPGTDGLAPGL